MWRACILADSRLVHMHKTLTLPFPLPFFPLFSHLFLAPHTRMDMCMCRYAQDTSYQVLQQVMKVNFYGPVAFTNAIVETMIVRQAKIDAHRKLHNITSPQREENDGGARYAVGVVSSVQGRLGIPQRCAYAASKHAIQGTNERINACTYIHAPARSDLLTCPSLVPPLRALRLHGLCPWGIQT